MDRSETRISQQSLDEAMTWHVRLASDAADEADWRAFVAWLEAAPAHRLAYEQMELLADTLDTAAPALADALPPLPESPALPEGVADLTSHRRAPGVSRRWLLAGVGLAGAGLAAGLTAAVMLRAPTPVMRVYRTGRGEQRDIRLADNSQLSLDTETVVEVAYAGDVRRVRLVQGVAAFDVVKDPERPFLVAAGDRQVRVVGTAFTVRHIDRLVRVGVARGLVEVAPLDGSAPPVRLQPGDQLEHRAGEARSTLQRIDPAAVMAWRDGRLSFDEVPLLQVLEELNRYYRQPIVAGDATIAGLPFSGVLTVGEQAETADRLASLLGLRADHQATRIVLVRPAAAR